MLTIRLSRTGKHKAPQYRIVLQENSQDPWAPAKEILGNYNPRREPVEITLKKERIEYWMSVGAKPSATVHNLLLNAGIIKGEKATTMSITKRRADKLVEQKAAAEQAKIDAEAKAKAEAEAKKAAEEAAKLAEAEAKAAAEEAAKAAAQAAAEAPAPEAAAEVATEPEATPTEEAPTETAT